MVPQALPGTTEYRTKSNLEQPMAHNQKKNKRPTLFVLNMNFLFYLSKEIADFKKLSIAILIRYDVHVSRVVTINLPHCNYGVLLILGCPLCTVAPMFLLYLIPWCAYAP